MQFIYQVSEEDHRYAQALGAKRLHSVLAKQWGIRLVFVAWALGLGYFILSGFHYWAQLDGDNSLKFGWVFLSGLLTVAGFASWVMLFQRASVELSVQGFARFPITEKLETSTEGIAIKSPHANIEIPWSEIDGYNEVENYFLLEIFRHSVYAVPIANIGQAAERDELRQIVREQTGGPSRQ